MNFIILTCKIYKIMQFYKVLSFFLLLINICHCGLFSWLFKNYETANVQQLPLKSNEVYEPTVVHDAALIANVPFEMTDTDEKFIKEISSLTSIQLSELDSCHHRVILSLKSTCSEMPEEELAKIAVNLLNCQSAIEGRSIYPCTQKMTLQECTHDMDMNTWNAYHIVSNRARAVCYQFRQQQFKAKTEMTINKLMLSATDQIEAMKQLEVTQNSLQEVTSETFGSLTSGHEVLLKQQEHLSSAQHSIHSYVASNIRELSKEKRLIALGQKELTHITESIKKKLIEAQKQMQDQGEVQRGSHNKILLDLASIQENAEKVGLQLDESTHKIIDTHQQTVLYYQHLMDDLKYMNSTVHHLMALLIKMRTKVEQRFAWLSALLGDTDETVQKIYTFVLHVCYLFISMISAGFLKVPYFTRVILVLIVPLNALGELKNATSFQFPTLTAILAGTLVLNITANYATKVYKTQLKGTNLLTDRNRKLASSKSPISNFATMVSIKKSSERDGHDSMKTITDECPPLIGNGLHKTLPFENGNSSLSLERVATVRQRLITRMNESSSYLHDSSSPLRSNTSLNSTYSNSPSRYRTFSPKTPCSALCKSGLKCRNHASSNSSLCFRHLHPSRESTPLK